MSCKPGLGQGHKTKKDISMLFSTFSFLGVVSHLLSLEIEAQLTIDNGPGALLDIQGFFINHQGIINFIQYTVDKGTRFLSAEFLSQIHRLINRNLWRYIIPV